MENLTIEQIQFIESLKEKFNSVNQSNNRTGNLIDISSIIDNEIKRKARKEEIKAIQEGYNKARKEQLMTDFNKLKTDIEALGLSISLYSDKYLTIKGESSSSSYCIEITYEYKNKVTYINEYESSTKNTDVYLDHEIRMKTHIYSYVYFDTIEQLVASNEFKTKLTNLYKAQNEG